MIDIESLRHPKEQLYFGIAAVFGGIVWLILLILLNFMLLFWAIGIAIISLIAEQFFKAEIMGNSIKVSETQYPEIYKIVRECSNSLNLSKVPEVFVVNSNGAINAVAIKSLSKQYVFLYSSLVDLMLLDKEGTGMDELKMIIGHEFAHHAAGHTGTVRNLLLVPARVIPFVGNAYSRACEHTADRIGAVFTKDIEASKRALVALACGSKSLVDKTNIESFMQQEKEVPPITGFINELYSTHPRMTLRVKEMEYTYNKRVQAIHEYANKTE